jgi:ribonuclease HI
MVDRDGLDADVALLRFNHIRAFTDGSFVRHPDLGEATTGWGFCVTEHLAHRREAEDRVFAELYGPTFLQSHPFWWIGALREDNNTAELSAIIEFLFYLRDYGIQRYVDQITEQQPLVVVIATDSAHSIDLLTNKVSPPPDYASLVTTARGLLDELSTAKVIIYFAKVPGHAGIPGNVRADILANKGRQALLVKGRFAPQSDREQGANTTPGVVLQEGQLSRRTSPPIYTRAPPRRLIKGRTGGTRVPVRVSAICRYDRLHAPVPEARAPALSIHTVPSSSSAGSAAV